MARDDLPTADQCEAIFHAALGEGDPDGVEAALRCLVVQDPRRAADLFETAKVSLQLVEAADSGRLGFTRDDLRTWLNGDDDAH